MANGYRTRLIGPTVAAIALGLAFPATCRAFFFFAWPDTPSQQPTNLIPDNPANPPSARSGVPVEQPPVVQPPVGGPSGGQHGTPPPLVPEPTTALATATGLGLLAAVGVTRRVRRNPPA